MSEWSEKLKIARKRAGFSQPQLAVKAGLGVATVQNIELKKGNPSIETLRQILNVLGLEMQISVKPIDWSTLSALGVPLMTKLSGKGFGHQGPTFRPTVEILKCTLVELVQAVEIIPSDSREQIALISFLLALMDHYPQFWARHGQGLNFWMNPSRKDKGSIKLRRIALAHLAGYL